ncbi:MAG: ABC transporter permease [Bacteroidota bacterium]
MLKKQAERFFKWFCHPEYYRDIRGDLEELYQSRLETQSKFRSDLFFVGQVLRCLRLSLIRPIKLFHPLKAPIMFIHHAKTALRFMRKERIYSMIKIGGFSLGVAASLLLFLFLLYELSYDSYIPENQDVYRVTMTYLEGEDITGVDFPAPFVDVLRNDYPEIEQAGRFTMPVFLKGARNLIRQEEGVENFYEEKVSFADQEFLDIIQAPMVYGDRSTALSRPYTIVISQSKAEKYFPGVNPVGKTLIVNDNEEQPYTIGGVMEDFPSNSHLDIDFIYTMEGVEFWEGERTNWCCNNHRNYVKVRKGTDVGQLNQKLAAIMPKYYLPSFKNKGIVNPEAAIDSMQITLQPISDIYLNAEVADNYSHGDMQLIWIFGAAAILILLLATINFINLSTARSAKRAREVGIRKATGAYQKQLVSQFLVESLLYSIISFGIGVLLAWILLPYFNQLSGKLLVIPWGDLRFIFILLGCAISIGILSGLYPALYLSSFKPIQVIKGKLSTGGRNPNFRNNLVLFQFTASIVLLIGTGVVNQQLRYILNAKIGFEKEQVLTLQGTQTLEDKVFTFKEELMAIPEVQRATISAFLPIEGAMRNSTGFFQAGKKTVDREATGQLWYVDYDYINTLGMELIEGRNFNPEMRTDSQAIIINRKLAQELGLQNPLNKRVQVAHLDYAWTVIGVVEDFHFESLRNQVSPLAFLVGNSTSSVSIRANAADMAEVLAGAKAVWKDFAPHQPIRYQFMDESYARMYEDVQRAGNLFTSFAGLAVVIACLGLFGLTAYMAEQRTKEMGIRKVLGASVQEIIRLLSQDFFKLVCISILVASPLAWYIMSRWLESFAYRIDLHIGIFLLVGLSTLFIALLTMSYHSIRTAIENPVKSIRTE